MGVSRVYLDNNATTQCDKRAVDAMLPYFSQHFGNAASNHVFGWEAKEAVQIAREQVADLIHAEPGEIVFTSGATESVNLAMKGVFESYSVKGNHFITCKTEHSSVLDSCKHIEKLGGEITYLHVNNEGAIDLDELDRSIRPSTVLVSLMYVNNETGTIHPIKEISRIARKHGTLFFTDATQAVGKINIDVNTEGIDLMAFSAHKLYGPKGIGALYVRRRDPRVRLISQMDGGTQEKDRRSGTLNVTGIIGFGKACELCAAEMKEDEKRLRGLRNRLEESLLRLGDVFINGNKEQRLGHVTNLYFRDASAEQIITKINKEVAITSGSACSSATFEPSHVLKALGFSDERARSSLRISLGRFTTEEEIDFAIEHICKTINNLRDLQTVKITNQ
jgi:Cysteine sulfinate desulfinase/cysteine desulfurase and related enzymes